MLKRKIVILFVSYYIFLVTNIFIFFQKTLVDKKKDKVEFKVIPKTNEEEFSMRSGCVIFIDSYRFLSSNLDKLVETRVNNSHKSPTNLKRNCRR